MNDLRLKVRVVEVAIPSCHIQHFPCAVSEALTVSSRTCVFFLKMSVVRGVEELMNKRSAEYITCSCHNSTTCFYWILVRRVFSELLRYYRVVCLFFHTSPDMVVR